MAEKEKRESETEAPLVTFALFAYNQEQYIREAIEGAFSQDYGNLEIILSDDCSSDRTFEVMKEMASQYQGQHCVRVRKSPINIGTLSHLLTVAYEAKGEFLVVAAGDDVSLPYRTSALISEFATAEIAAASSDDFIVDHAGNEVYYDEDRLHKRSTWHLNNPAWLHGGTAAYRTSFLKSIPIPKYTVLFEDVALIGVLEITCQKAIYLKKKLVKYRYHENNLSSRHTRREAFDVRERADLLRWERVSVAKAYSVEAAAYLLKDRKPEILKKYSESSNYFRLLSGWPSLSLMDKVRLLTLAARNGEVSACLPRLFGMRVFRILKYAIGH